MISDFTTNTPGRCACGCWSKTSFNKHSDAYAGYEKGTFTKFYRGHQTRQSAAMFVIEFAGYKTPCWLWQLGKTNGGYSVMHRSGKSRSGHKQIYEMVNEPVPEGMELDHLCRNRHCVRPDHLEVVTPQVNILRCSNTQIPQAVVDSVRELHAAGMRKADIARKYGIGQPHVGDIIRGRRRQSVL